MLANYSVPEDFKLTQPKLRTLASLKTDDIPGAQPKRRYDKPLPNDPYHPMNVQRQDSDSLRSSPTLSYPTNPNESYQRGVNLTIQTEYAGQRPQDPNNFRNIGYETLKDIMPLQIMRSPGASPKRQELKSVDLRNHPGYSSITQMRNPMYTNFDFRSNKIPPMEDTSKKTLFYIQDSLDTLQKEVEEKSQSPTLPRETRLLEEEPQIYPEPVQVSSQNAYYEEEPQQPSQRPVPKLPKSEIWMQTDFEDLKPRYQMPVYQNTEQERDINRLHGFVSPSKLSRQFETVSPTHLKPMKDANDYYIFNPVTLRYEFKYRTKPDLYNKAR